MNKDFEIIGNKVHIFTDNGKVIKDAKKDIEDILICENNIEEIEENLQNNSNKITLYKNKMLLGFGSIGAGILWLSGFIFSFSIGLLLLSIIQLLGAACCFSYSYFIDIKSNLKHINANKSMNEELIKNLEIEKEKLNELNKSKNIDLNDSSTMRKVIYRSNEIYNLKRKLYIIYFYQTNKQKFIKYYKKNILKEKILNDHFLYENEYLLLEELIKNDLSINKNIKQKKLSKNK